MGNEEFIGSTLYELHDYWPTLSKDERIEAFNNLSQVDAEELVLELPISDMADIILALPPREQRIWIRFLPPEDVTDLIQNSEPEETAHILNLLDIPTRKEVTSLLAYREDTAGGLMSPRYARVRPDMTADEAVNYFRNQLKNNINTPATIYYIYVLDKEQQLLGVISFRKLFSAQGDLLVRDLMRKEVITVKENQDQEKISYLSALYNLPVIPVVDNENRMKGIVTNEDIMEVFQTEATEDIHKYGGVEVLEERYTEISFRNMFRKRGRWLAILFIGELFTAVAMAIYEEEIAKAVVLALFVPLIISSGGNSGSQASTLVIRALALQEIKLRDWLYIIRKELVMGISLGILLGIIGFLRILIWELFVNIYGAYYLLIALTISFSLIFIVTWGTLIGSMLPLLLKKVGLDPAVSSAPLVATILDVSGLMIYFTTARILLTGSLL